MQKPFITIITPSYNRASFIEAAIQSVLKQGYPFVEHIIVDGNSTDNTRTILAKFPHLITLIEPDRGLYDAINKGILMARGEIIGLLNSDDAYEPAVFSEVVAIFRERKDVDVVIGQAVSLEYINSSTKEYPPLRQEMLLQQLVSNPPIINAWFFRHHLFERMGGFNLDFPIGADRDFLIRLCLSGINPYFVDRVFYRYGRHSDSLTVNSQPQAKEHTMKENLRLARKYMGITPRGTEFWRQCQVWHDLTSLEMSILLTRQLRIMDLLRTAGSAIRHNWKWLFIVVAQSPERIQNFVSKRRNPQGV